MKSYFAILLRIAQMGAMKELVLAKTSARHFALWAALCSHVTRIVVFTGGWPAALGLNPFVRTAVTWMKHFARASVTLSSQQSKTHIGGHVPMVSRDVYSKHLAVTGIQIVMMQLN